MRTKQTDSKLTKRILTILIACAVIGLILSFILFLTDPAKTQATSTLQFSFKDAADGLAPNGIRFGVGNITDDAVLTAALTEVGMEKKYSTEQIRSSLTVTGIYPEDLIKQMTSYDSLLDFTTSRESNITDYSPTQFSISLSNDFDPFIPEKDLTALLNSILRTYKSCFIAKYSIGLDVTGYEQLFGQSEYDYLQQLEVEQLEMNQIARYAEELYEMDPTFIWEGQNFNDISVRMMNLVNNDIVRMNASLTMNALTKEPERLIMQYECEIRDLENELEKKNAEMASLDKILDAYQKNEIIYLSTAGSLTKIEENSSETYDKLVQKRKEVADRITSIKSDIESYQLKMTDLTGTANNSSVEDNAPVEDTTVATTTSVTEDKAEQIQTLEANIAELQNEKSTVIRDFAALQKAYSDFQLNDSTVSTTRVKYSTRQLLSGAFIVKCIKTAGPIFVIGLLICLILKICKEKKAA